MRQNRYLIVSSARISWLVLESVVPEVPLLAPQPMQRENVRNIQSRLIMIATVGLNKFCNKVPTLPKEL
uniref:Uncharacterized protein n=1 Tax=Kalanchoe fedtschenkoi TaxID=63787 RepID=A0A7N0TU56_KALFE